MNYMLIVKNLGQKLNEEKPLPHYEEILVKIILFLFYRKIVTLIS